ncbi:hypothetical protein ABIA31_004538 [Catenulispora sp. MAP5-51]
MSVTEPIKALRHRGLLTLALTALCYNWGFFTLLGYAPFPMKLGTHQLGYVFTAWGVLVAGSGSPGPCTRTSRCSPPTSWSSGCSRTTGRC